VVAIPDKMSLQDAARTLVQNRIDEAAVVDWRGKCVGVFSAVDFMRAAGKDADACLGSGSMPAACSYQRRGKTQAGEQVVVCTLPAGVCPIQKKEKDAAGNEMTICTEPHGVLTDWQTVETEDAGAKEVWRYMTADPVTVLPDTPVRTLATRMIDARIHRIIVLDEQQRPIGVVSGTDILAAVAFGDDEPREPILEK
jgi:CBS domain-containing protein